MNKKEKPSTTILALFTFILGIYLVLRIAVEAEHDCRVQSMNTQQYHECLNI